MIYIFGGPYWRTLCLSQHTSALRLLWCIVIEKPYASISAALVRTCCDQVGTIEEDGSLLEFHPGPLEDAVLIMRAGDGSGDGKFPMYTECYNLPQMEACQEVRHCHVTENGRFVESVEGEHLHLTTYYTKWDEVNKAEVEVCGAKKRIVQAYGGDGADLVKKKGTAGFSSHHWCPHCHADQSCKHKLTFLHPEIKPRVQAYREWEHDGCKVEGVCVCTEF